MIISSWNVNSVRARIENIKEYLKKYLASFKIPEHFDLHPDKLPRTASGKIYKLTLRNELKRKMGIID